MAANSAQASEKAWFSGAGIRLESGWKPACQFGWVSPGALTGTERPGPSVSEPQSEKDHRRPLPRPRAGRRRRRMENRRSRAAIGRKRPAGLRPVRVTRFASAGNARGGGRGGHAGCGDLDPVGPVPAPCGSGGVDIERVAVDGSVQTTVWGTSGRIVRAVKWITSPIILVSQADQPKIRLRPRS